MLKNIYQKNNLSLYESELSSTELKVLLMSSPETRDICNDPLVYGCSYTDALKSAMSKLFTALKETNNFFCEENSTHVLNLLRGGLNFNLREALAAGLKWNRHYSSFLSAQRARVEDSEDWIITENSYTKVELGKTNQVVLGDVLATGTSFEYALKALIRLAKETDSKITSLYFVTIGGTKAHELINKYLPELKSIGLEKAYVIFIEGIFKVADVETRMSVKITGTDLLRTQSVLTPEFTKSQYENPLYPLERCTIYDAGSRAYNINEYLTDVRHYWRIIQQHIKAGKTFEELLTERFSELDPKQFSSVDLQNLVKERLEQCKVN